MAKKQYIGVSDLARKIKKGYFGDNNIAHKIKKAYIGIGNVARPFWSGGTLTYYGKATAMAANRFQYAATTIGNYALFGEDPNIAQVEVYNSSLTRGTPLASYMKRS